jgi:hypothetical protein
VPIAPAATGEFIAVANIYGGTRLLMVNFLQTLLDSSILDAENETELALWKSLSQHFQILRRLSERLQPPLMDDEAALDVWLVEPEQIRELQAGSRRAWILREGLPRFRRLLGRNKRGE